LNSRFFRRINHYNIVIESFLLIASLWWLSGGITPASTQFKGFAFLVATPDINGLSDEISDTTGLSDDTGLSDEILDTTGLSDEILDTIDLFDELTPDTLVYQS